MAQLNVTQEIASKIGVTHTESMVSSEPFNRSNYAGGQRANFVSRSRTTGMLLLSTFLLLFFTSCRDEENIVESRETIIPMTNSELTITPYCVGYYHNLAMHEIIYNTQIDTSMSDSNLTTYLQERIETVLVSLGLSHSENCSPCYYQTLYNSIANEQTHTLEMLADSLNSDLLIIRDFDGDLAISQKEVDFINQANYDIFINIETDDIKEIFAHINKTSKHLLYNEIGKLFDTTKGEGFVAIMYLSTAMYTAEFWDGVFAIPGFIESLEQHLDGVKGKIQDQFQLAPAALFAKHFAKKDAIGAVEGVGTYLVGCGVVGHKPTLKEGVAAAGIGAVYGSVKEAVGIAKCIIGLFK